LRLKRIIIIPFLIPIYSFFEISHFYFRRSRTYWVNIELGTGQKL
jgi:hypothetical protein